MKAISLFLLIAAFTYIQNVNAQNTNADSAAIIKVARQDARSFRLKKDEMDRFYKENFPSGSDYFKPNAAYASKPELLNDSAYVQAFRYAAFYNTVNFRPTHSISELRKQHASMPHYTTDAQKAARRDARRFRLPKDVLVKFKAGQFPNTSDYFKPTGVNSRHPALLSDSVYVKTFRYESCNVALQQSIHPVGTGFLIGGISAVGLTIFMVTILLTFGHEKG